MANILPILALITAGLAGLSMFNQSAPQTQKGGRRKTKKNRRK